MKKLLIFFLSIFLFTTVYGQEAIFKNVRSADSIRSLLENTKAGGAPVNIELKNTEGFASLRLDENGDFTIDGGNYVNIPMLQNSLVGSTYYLDGVDDYINLDLAATELVNVNNTKGAVVWRGRLHDFTTYGLVLWSFGDTDANEFMVITIEGPNQLSGVCKVSGSDVFAWLAYNTFTEDIIYTIIFVQDGIEPKLYINGKLEPINIYRTVDKTSWFHQLTGVDNCRIGCNDYNTFGNAHFLNCDISLFQVWTRVPTLAEIEQMSLWGSDNSPIPYSDVGASNDIVSTYDTSATQDLSIILTANLNYSFIKGTADSLMIGLTKIVSDSTFLYTSGTVRANGGGAGDLTGSNLFHSGCIVNLNGGGMADDYWYDNSGNGLDGTNNGATLIRNEHTVFNTITIDNSGDIRSGSDSAVDAGTMFTYLDNLVPSPLESGTADGQFLFWDTDIWKHTENSELVWDDVNKRLGVGTVTPSEKLEINGNIKADNLGLVLITENAQTGWRLYGMDAANYGDIGDISIDLSYSETVGTYGATGWATNAHGYETKVSGDSGSNVNGYICEVPGDNGANANGFCTTAIGNDGANANGYYTVAGGNYGASANGKYTKATGVSSAISGRGHNSSNYPEAVGNVSFVHQEVDVIEGIKKAEGANSVILGGKNHSTSVAAVNSVSLGGVGQSVTDPNTIKLPHLQIDSTGTIGKSALVTNAGDSLVSAKEVNAAIEAATGAIVYSTAYSATNYTVLAADEVVIFTDTGAAKDTCWLPDLYSGKGVWIRRGDNTNDVVITANDLTTDGSTNITNYNMTGTVNSVFCVQESTQWNIVQIGN